MELITLPNLTNPYPQPGNYIKTAEDEITLFGLYPGKNKYIFTVDDLTEVTPIDNTTFRFILSISNDELDVNEPKLFTSKAYYDDLLLASDEGNPYFINYSFNNIFIVNVYLERLINTFTPLNEFESPFGIYVKQNIFLTDEREILYDKLVEYIDWLVTTITLDEIDTDGVIPYYEISNYTGGKFNTDTLKWGDEDSIIKEIKIKDIVDELNSINSDIRAIGNYLLNPNTVNFSAVGFAINKVLTSTGQTAFKSATTLLGGSAVTSLVSTIGSKAVLTTVGLASGIGVGIAVAAIATTTIVNFIKGLTSASKAKAAAVDEVAKYTNFLRNELARLQRRKTELEIELISLES